MAWTVDQVLGLAPDSSAAQGGRSLASLRKWVQAAQTEGAIWGECQGSGAQPYRTVIDLGGPAFKCGCPSRKFPCKHALGLFLVYASNAADLAVLEPPAWASEWLANRLARADQEKQREERRLPRSIRRVPPRNSKSARSVATSECERESTTWSGGWRTLREQD